MEKHNEFIEEILNDLSDLNRNIAIDKTLSYLKPEQFDALFEQFDLLDSQIFDHKRISINSSERLDKLTFIMAQMANLNFSFIADEGEVNNHLDHIAYGLNMMRDRLKEKIDRFQLIESLVDSHQNIMIVTDELGNIVFSNKRISYLGIKPKLVEGKRIRDLILSNLLMPNYTLDLDFDDDAHDLLDDYFENKEAKIALNVTRKKIISSNKEIQYIYKIQAMNNSYYVKPKTSNEDVNVIQTIYDLSTKCRSHNNNRERILRRLKKALKSNNNDPLDEQLIENIDLMLRRTSH